MRIRLDIHFYYKIDPELCILFYVLAHSLQFSTVAAATANANMTDSSWYEYDWRRRLGDGGSGDTGGSN